MFVVCALCCTVTCGVTNVPLYYIVCDRHARFHVRTMHQRHGLYFKINMGEIYCQFCVDWVKEEATFILNVAAINKQELNSLEARMQILLNSIKHR